MASEPKLRPQGSQEPNGPVGLEMVVSRRINDAKLDDGARALVARDACSAHINGFHAGHVVAGGHGLLVALDREPIDALEAERRLIRTPRRRRPRDYL